MDSRISREEDYKKNKTSKKKYKKRSRSKQVASESMTDSAKLRGREKSYSNDKRKRRSRSRSRSNSRDDNERKKYRSRKESRSKSRNRNKKRSRTRSKSENRKVKKGTKVEPKAPNEVKSKFSNFTEANIEELEQLPTVTAGSQTVQSLALAQAAKVDRKLYIGNLPTGITPASLVQLLNTALITLKANTKTGDPVLSAWISTDGHYAFVEFRSAEEANNGFLLNTISILGQPLKVGRPKTYSGSLTSIEDGTLPNTVAAALQAGTMNAPLEGKKLDDDEEYNDIILDIKEECGKYGRVDSVFIPRKDVEDNPTPGMGNAYVEFCTLEEAKEARKQMTGRKFNKKTVNIKYTPEEAYNSKKFD